MNRTHRPQFPVNIEYELLIELTLTAGPVVTQENLIDRVSGQIRRAGT